MPTPQQIDVLIIGAGPAGISTALHLVKMNPDWTTRLVVVDKAVHPREKLCGGGITQLGLGALTKLGLTVETPNVPVNEVQMVYSHLKFAVRDQPVFRIVRRDEFDYWLVGQAEQQGITVRQGEAVITVTPQADYVEVVTEKTVFHAGVVVAADGSRSFVRRVLNWPGSARMARLLEVLTPEQAETLPEFQAGIAVFDFSPMQTGVQGYYWDFPSLVKGQSVMNRGVFDSRIRPERTRASLPETLRGQMQQRQRRLDDYPLKGHPIHWFDRQGQFARDRILLVGDAAGVDPLLGEGISFALAYGEVAAGAIIEAFAHRNFSFDSYKAKILAHEVLSHLPVRTTLARLVYRIKSPLLLRWAWRFAPLLVRFLAWYKPAFVPVRQPRLEKIGDV